MYDSDIVFGQRRNSYQTISLEQFIRPCGRHNTTHTLHHKQNRGCKLNEDHYGDTESGLKVFHPCMELYVAFTFISHLLDAKGRDKNT